MTKAPRADTSATVSEYKTALTSIVEVAFIITTPSWFMSLIKAVVC